MLNNNKRIEVLKKEIDRLKERHGAELERLRAAHAAELEVLQHQNEALTQINENLKDQVERLTNAGRDETIADLRAQLKRAVESYNLATAKAETTRKEMNEMMLEMKAVRERYEKRMKENLSKWR